MIGASELARLRDEALLINAARGAVVDARLRVHGVEALHVVDASVMPTVVRAPTNLSSIAIGERAAELLR